MLVFQRGAEDGVPPTVQPQTSAPLDPNCDDESNREHVRHSFSTDRIARGAVIVAVASGAACGGLRIRNPIQTGPEAAPTAAEANASPPQTFVRSTSDARTTRVIDVREGMAKDVLFKTVSEALTPKFTIDVNDQRAGFLMTSWQTGVRSGVPDVRYRSRLVIRFIGDDWKQMAVHSEANWQRGDEWDIGYDVEQLANVSVDLSNKVGKKPN